MAGAVPLIFMSSGPPVRLLRPLRATVAHPGGLPASIGWEDVFSRGTAAPMFFLEASVTHFTDTGGARVETVSQLVFIGGEIPCYTSDSPSMSRSGPSGPVFFERPFTMTNAVGETVAVAIADAKARMFEPRKISGGYSWPECPRWHDNTFWFTDMYTGTIKTLDADGQATVVVDANGRAKNTDVPIVLGGFGWLPDGRLIVNSMHEKLVLVHGGGAPDDLSVYADVAEFSLAATNDMVVDADGRAYITQLGFDIFKGDEPVASPLIVVEPDGSAAVPAGVGPLMCANGIVLSADGTKLYTAEVMANKITIIDRASDGTLSNASDFASCPFMPDGIGLDEEGGVWAAMPGSGHIARFTEEGMTDAIEVPLVDGVASACLLGGPDRSTLYVTVGFEVFDFEKSAREAQGTIWVADVGKHGGETRP